MGLIPYITRVTLLIITIEYISSKKLHTSTSQSRHDNHERTFSCLNTRSHNANEGIFSNNNEENLEMNDIVQKQYMMLPYPPFTETDLSEEEKYYKSSRRNTPNLFSYLIQLEYINHYLFQGKRTFM